jgi:hypothetical protein
MRLYTQDEFELLSEDGKYDAIVFSKGVHRKVRHILVETAYNWGKNAAYLFQQPEDYHGDLRSELSRLSDVVPKQSEAFEHLKKQLQLGFNSCFGWSWCLRDNLRPLFARNASVREIEECAARNQGALPDYAVVSLLKALRQEFLGTAEYQRRQEFYQNRKRA